MDKHSPVVLGITGWLIYASMLFAFEQQNYRKQDKRINLLIFWADNSGRLIATATATAFVVFLGLGEFVVEVLNNISGRELSYNPYYYFLLPTIVHVLQWVFSRTMNIK